MWMYTNLLHKNSYLFCIFTIFLNVRHDAAKVPRSCAQTKMYPACYSFAEQIVNYFFLKQLEITGGRTLCKTVSDQGDTIFISQDEM